MESAKSGHRTVSSRRRDAGKPAEAGIHRVAKTDPRSRAVNRSSRANDYASFSAEILRDLDPQGPLEGLVADHVVHSAWKLRANLDQQAPATPTAKADPDAGVKKIRTRTTELERASRSLREALESLVYLKKSRITLPSPDLAVVENQDDDSEILPNDWPIEPCDDAHDFADDSDEPTDEAPNWHERLVFDFDISDISPVVKGTWVTVSHVVSLIVDGWAWADILRSHPELTEEDIRICVAYAMAEENTHA